MAIVLYGEGLKILFGHVGLNQRFIWSSTPEDTQIPEWDRLREAKFSLPE